MRPGTFGMMLKVRDEGCFRKAGIDNASLNWMPKKVHDCAMKFIVDRRAISEGIC